MPLLTITPLRARFIADVRAQYLARYRASCPISDNRILVAARFFRFVHASDSDIHLLLDDLHTLAAIKQEIIDYHNAPDEGE